MSLESQNAQTECISNVTSQCRYAPPSKIGPVKQHCHGKAICILFICLIKGGGIQNDFNYSPDNETKGKVVRIEGPKIKFEQ